MNQKNEYDRLAWLSIKSQIKNLREQRDELLQACVCLLASDKQHYRDKAQEIINKVREYGK